MKAISIIIGAIALSVIWVGFDSSLGLGWKIVLSVISVAIARVVGEMLSSKKSQTSKE